MNPMNKLIIKLTAKVMIARKIKVWEVAKAYRIEKKRIEDEIEMHREAQEW